MMRNWQKSGWRIRMELFLRALQAFSRSRRRRKRLIKNRIKKRTRVRKRIMIMIMKSLNLAQPYRSLSILTES